MSRLASLQKGRDWKPVSRLHSRFGRGTSNTSNAERQALIQYNAKLEKQRKENNRINNQRKLLPEYLEQKMSRMRRVGMRLGFKKAYRDLSPAIVNHMRNLKFNDGQISNVLKSFKLWKHQRRGRTRSSPSAYYDYEAGMTRVPDHTPVPRSYTPAYSFGRPNFSKYKSNITLRSGEQSHFTAPVIRKQLVTVDQPSFRRSPLKYVEYKSSQRRATRQSQEIHGTSRFKDRFLDPFHGVYDWSIIPTANLIRHPVRSIKGTYNYIKNPHTIKYSLERFGYNLKSNPGYTFGGIAGVLIPTSSPFFIKTAKNIYVKIGSKYVKAEDVFDNKVLAGKQQFPTTTKNIYGQIREFERKKFGVTASPFSPKRYDTAKGGYKGKRNLEDSGIWMTPEGRASPHFLGVTPDGYGWSITFNPFKDITKRPSLLKIKINDYKRLPKEIRNSKDFKLANEYMRSQSKKGYAWIPLRSELMETPEIQALLPEGTIIRNTQKGLKGYKRYTSYAGHNIPIREYEVVRKVGNNIKNPKLNRGEIHLHKANKNYKSYSNYYKNRSSVTFIPHYYRSYYKSPKYKSKFRYGSNYKRGSSNYYKSITSKPYYPSYYSPTQSSTSFSGIPFLGKPKSGGKRGSSYVLSKKRLRNLQSYQPIYYHKGKEIKDTRFVTLKDAENKAMYIVDNSPITTFKIFKVEGVGFKSRYKGNVNKFTKRGSTYKEKRYYRYDKPSEKSNSLAVRIGRNNSLKIVNS